MNEAGEQSKGYASLQATAQAIFREEGWQGLFSGVAVSIVTRSTGCLSSLAI